MESGMPSIAIRMMKTAGTVLFQEGPFALMKAVVRKLGFGPIQPEESNIAFEILNVEGRPGIMIDVGAHYGGALERFAKSQWQVYAFEPDSQNRELLDARFGDKLNVCIDSRAVSDKQAANAPLFRSDESTGISGLSAFRSTHRVCETVDITTLADFANDQSIDQIDFLKIDTEGFDLFVLKGVPWEFVQPRLILCEFEDHKTIHHGYTFHDLASFLGKKGYRMIVSEWYPIERYGVTHRWRRFAPYPCALEDQHAWGNILATNNDDLYTKLVAACKLI